ncbi:MAG TPA: hypothetical protein DCZ76_04030 [Treponema sp.]|nr:hypothetical protein [Treponema sp.]
MQFFPMSFLTKTHKFSLQRHNAPSMALLVCERGKIAWICPDCRDGHSKTWPTVQKNKTKPTFLISIILRIIKEKKSLEHSPKTP